MDKHHPDNHDDQENQHDQDDPVTESVEDQTNSSLPSETSDEHVEFDDGDHSSEEATVSDHEDATVTQEGRELGRESLDNIDHTPEKPKTDEEGSAPADNTSSPQSPSNQKASQDQFQHLANRSQIATNRKSSSKTIITVVAVVAVIAFAYSLLPGHKPSHAPQNDSQQGRQPNYALMNNEAKLRAQEAERHRQPQVGSELPPPAPQQSPQNNGGMQNHIKAQIDAPTEAYSATLKEISTEKANHHTAGSAPLAGKSAFSKFADAQSDQSASVFATKLTHPKTTVAEGTFVHAVLETAINSDLPGMVSAQTTRPVYAYVGGALLIPAGSRVIGQYTSMSSNGLASVRIFIMWNRIITPEGISIMINSPGANALGEAGMGADSVNRHFWRMFSTATLFSVMGVTTANAGVSATTQPNSANQYQQAVAQAFQQESAQSLKQNLNIRPTLRINQGDRVTIFIARDLDLHDVLRKHP